MHDTVSMTGCYLKLAVRTDMYTNWFGTVTDSMKSCLMHSGGFI